MPIVSGSADGKQIGRTTNDGAHPNGTYVRSIEERATPTGTGPFRNGKDSGWQAADFDQSLTPITSYHQSGGGGSYEVRGGETLAGIAAQLWGDASLWYKLAQANGLGAHAALIEGQRLTVPAGVMKNSHNAGTFRPYDPAETLGDVGPSPAPGKQTRKCGAFGAILLVAIAVAVTIATSDALVAGASVARCAPIPPRV